jgi:hypothetical protein
VKVEAKAEEAAPVESWEVEPACPVGRGWEVKTEEAPVVEEVKAEEVTEAPAAE